MTEERAVLAGGCFWGMQDLVRRYDGVKSTRVGYSGGDVPNATYRNHGTRAESSSDGRALVCAAAGDTAIIVSSIASTNAFMATSSDYFTHMHKIENGGCVNLARDVLAKFARRRDSVCRRRSSCQASQRREVLSFNHHAEVAALPLAQQNGLLDRGRKPGYG